MRYTPIPAASALAIALAGCGHSATIHARGAADYEGRIVGADRQQVWLDPDGPEPALAVERAVIDDIDHPGDGMMAGGVTLGLLGAGVSVVGLTRFAGDDSWALVGGGVMLGVGAALLVPGILLFDGGYSRSSASQGAASPSAGPPTGAAIRLGPGGLSGRF